MLATISAILGLIVSIVSVFTLIFGYIKNLTKIKEGIKAQLRSEIEHCYYKNLEQKTLREFERKNLDSIYQAYHDGLHGNTFAQDLYDEMREWRIER